MDVTFVGFGGGGQGRRDDIYLARLLDGHLNRRRLARVAKCRSPFVLNAKENVWAFPQKFDKISNFSSFFYYKYQQKVYKN